MKKIFYLIFAAFILLSCNNQKVESEKNNVKQEQNEENLENNQQVQLQDDNEESPHDTKVINDLPNPGYLLYEDVVQMEYPEYDENEFKPKFDAKKTVLAILRYMKNDEGEPKHYLRLDIREDPMPNSLLKDRLSNYPGYEFVDGMGFQAAWSEKLGNLTFRYRNYSMNVTLKDNDITNEERLRKAKNIAQEVANRLDNVVSEMN